MQSQTFRYNVQVESTPYPRYESRIAEGCYMPDSYLNGRPVYFGDLELDGCDSYFLDACYADTGEELDDNELAQLTDEEADYIVRQNLEWKGYYKK